MNSKGFILSLVILNAVLCTANTIGCIQGVTHVVAPIINGVAFGVCLATLLNMD